MVSRTIAPAQGTASGSNAVIAAATSRGTRGSVEVVLDSGRIVDVSLSEKFWTTCPELRSAVIGRWMLDLGVIPWAKGKPPEFDLEPIGDRRFRLARR